MKLVCLNQEHVYYDEKYTPDNEHRDQYDH